MRLDPNKEASTFPRRAELPVVAGTPAGSAWFWGGDDELGRLNLLTPERTLEATQESVKTGHVVSLNLPLDLPHPAIFGRDNFKHEIRSIGPGAFDDVWTSNTQSSSQWDGFRHFADPVSGRFYNGITREAIAPEDGEEDAPTKKLGIDAWAKHGVVGRGVLLDVYDWKQRSYDPFTSHRITANDLRDCAKAQEVEFRTGDILIVRTGWLQKYLSLDPTQRKERAEMEGKSHAYAGLEASEEMKDFLFDSYFAAAASDSPSFETWPAPSWEASLHASMLPLWGMPIGELWDLEALSAECKAQKRWTFLLTSAPGNVPGGVASPPNALALF